MNIESLKNRACLAECIADYGKKAAGGNGFARTLMQGYTASSATAPSSVSHGTLRMGWAHSSFNPATGQELHMKYDESSSKEDPVMYVEGKDSSGKVFQARIHLNEIDMNNASLTEMTALRVHLAKEGDHVIKSHANIPLMALIGERDVNQKMDFEQFFRELASMSCREGNMYKEEQYMSELERYLLFLHI